MGFVPSNADVYVLFPRLIYLYTKIHHSFGKLTDSLVTFGCIILVEIDIETTSTRGRTLHKERFPNSRESQTAYLVKLHTPSVNPSHHSSSKNKSLGICTKNYIKFLAGLYDCSESVLRATVACRRLYALFYSVM